MTNGELSKGIKKYLIPLIGSQYAFKGNILYKTPVNEILLGFCFEQSASDKDGFYVWVFAQPLYIPSEDFILTFGKRLRGSSNGDWWETSDETIDKKYRELAYVMDNEGLEYLEKVSDPKMFCEFVRKNNDRSIRESEALVYSEFYSDMPDAESDAMRLKKNLQEKEDLSIEWINGILQNLETLVQAKRKSKDAVRSILLEWRSYSLNNLGI